MVPRAVGKTPFDAFAVSTATDRRLWGDGAQISAGLKGSISSVQWVVYALY